MLKKIAIAIVVIVAVIVGLALTKPNTFSVVRVATIKAPPEKIAPLIADFHNWLSWSPWEGLDPQMQRTFSGAPNGVGAVYAWQGNSKVGQGRMEVSSVTVPGSILIKLDFLEPIASHNIADFKLAPQGDSTVVTWTMTGPMDMLSKVMNVFVSMDAMIGPDFERGLAKLKSVAEK